MHVIKSQIHFVRQPLRSIFALSIVYSVRQVPDTGGGAAAAAHGLCGGQASLLLQVLALNCSLH